MEKSSLNIQLKLSFSALQRKKCHMGLEHNAKRI